MTNAQFLLKKYSPLILTSVSVIGSITSTVLAVKVTPKALKLINEAKKEKGSNLTKTEIVKVAWKPYIPTVISLATTITSILSLHILNQRTQNALMTAYTTLNNLHQEYIAKTKELYGDDADQKVRNAILNDQPMMIKDLTDGKQLFWDYQSLRFFESTIDEVLRAENQLNAEFAASGAVTLNDFYDLLGLERQFAAQEIGWYDHGTFFEIKFENQLMLMDVGDDRQDKLEVFCINPITEPNVIFDPNGIMLMDT